MTELISIQNQRNEIDRQRVILEQQKTALDTRVCNMNSFVSAALFQTLQMLLVNANSSNENQDDADNE